LCQQKQITMTTKEFLTANKQEVISYYNTNIAPLYSATLVEFMTDLLNNFRKITTGEDFKKFDLMGNLSEAKSRLGLMTKIEYAEDKKHNAMRAKYAGTQYMALV
jgi:hypothetical protein